MAQLENGGIAVSMAAREFIVALTEKLGIPTTAIHVDLVAPGPKKFWEMTWRMHAHDAVKARMEWGPAEVMASFKVFNKVLADEGWRTSYQNTIEAGELTWRTYFEIERNIGPIGKEVPGEELDPNPGLQLKRIIREYQTHAHALWSTLTAIELACDGNDSDENKLKLVKTLAESRRMHFVSGNKGIHRVTSSGVVEQPEPDRGFNAIGVEEVKRAEEMTKPMQYKFESYLDEIEHADLQLRAGGVKSLNLWGATPFELLSKAAVQIERLDISDGDTVLVRYDDDLWVPSNDEGERLRRQIKQFCGADVSIIIVPKAVEVASIGKLGETVRKEITDAMAGVMETFNKHTNATPAFVHDEVAVPVPVTKEIQVSEPLASPTFPLPTKVKDMIAEEVTNICGRAPVTDETSASWKLIWDNVYVSAGEGSEIDKYLKSDELRFTKIEQHRRGVEGSQFGFVIEVYK